VSSGKTEGEIPLPIADFQNRTFIFHRLVPFSSLASGEHREAFALVPGTYAVFALSPAHRSPSPSGTQQKASEITHEQAKEKLPLDFIGDAAPNVGRPQANATPNFLLTPTKKGMSERETTNAPTKVRRKKGGRG
jgi:hypothetical protein